MRKLWLLVLLVPLVGVWLYGCDETPDEPGSAVAATTAGESSTPQMARVGAQAKTVRLSGVEVPGWAAGDANVGFHIATVDCSEGKWPIAGGYSIIGATNDYTVISNGPRPSAGNTHGSWSVEAKRTAGSDTWNLLAWAVCVDAEAASP